jgi:hypothetical protein
MRGNKDYPFLDGGKLDPWGFPPSETGEGELVFSLSFLLSCLRNEGNERRGS